jgi:hypothetical protein
MDYKDIHVRIRIPRWILPSPASVLFTLLVVAGVVWASYAGAFSPNERMLPSSSLSTIPYQGRLADASGNAITATRPMQFRLYGAATGGSPLWTENWPSVVIDNGLFNVLLGTANPIMSTISSHPTLWIGVTVGTDPEMSPRVQLGSVPYAMLAQSVPDGSITDAKLAPGAGNQFGGRENSFPYIVGMSNFMLHQGNICNGNVPLESSCGLGTINAFFRMKHVGYSATGRIDSSNNSTGVARWGYAFTYFLSNPDPGKTLNLSFSTCNDLAVYRMTGEVNGDSLGPVGSLVYHRTPGTGDGGSGCPCSASPLSPTITVPTGDFRITILTRGGDCTSYLNWPAAGSASNWITQNNLRIDWDNLRVFLGEN